MDRRLARAVGGQAGDNGIIFKSPETSDGTILVSEVGYHAAAMFFNDYPLTTGEPYRPATEALRTVKQSLFNTMLPITFAALLYALTGIPSLTLIGLIWCFQWVRHDFNNICDDPVSIQSLRRYHAAEHKAINCLERGLEPSLAAFRNQSRLNWRCGGMPTGLYLCLALVMIPLMILLTDLMRQLLPGGPLYAVLLAAVVFDVSFGLLFLGGLLIRLPHNQGLPRCTRFLFAPMMAYQFLTTADPTDDDLNIALLGVTQMIEQMRGQSFSAAAD